MFSFTGLNKEQVKRLREEHSIYIVDSGRINVADDGGEPAGRVQRNCRGIEMSCWGLWRAVGLATKPQNTN